MMKKQEDNNKEDKNYSLKDESEKPSWIMYFIGFIVIAIIVLVIVFSVLALIGPSVGNVFTEIRPHL